MYKRQIFRELSAVRQIDCRMFRKIHRELLWHPDVYKRQYQDFLKGEVRYMSLAMKNPERAAELFARNEAEAKERYAYLEKLVTLYGND